MHCMATFESAGLQLGSIPPSPAVSRLLSLDALRGFTMICMISEGFGLLYFQKSPIIGPISTQFRHVDWNIGIPDGIHYWDLIQPFFMFVVGAVMPVSFTR